VNDSKLGWFFGVVVRPRTWLNVLFQWLAFPLGLFYFVFLSVGLSMGLGLIIIWIGIPILLVVAGAWWLFGAFERVQAKYLLGAEVPQAPRAWEGVNGVWGKLKTHFGSAATWKDLLYLFAKLAFGIVSTTLLMTVAGTLFWCLALPVAAVSHVDIVTTSAGGWHPPLWLGLLGIPAGLLALFVGLHLLNGWGWVCRVWAEMLFGAAPQTPAPAATEPGAIVPPAPVPGAIAPLVSVPAPPQPPSSPEATGSHEPGSN
jgi:Putative sensor